MVLGCPWWGSIGVSMVSMMVGGHGVPWWGAAGENGENLRGSLVGAMGAAGVPWWGPWGKSSGGGGAWMGAVDGTCGRPHPLFLAFGPAGDSLPPPPITSDNGENVKRAG